MKNVFRKIIICLLLFLPLSMYAAGSPEKETRTVPVDINLTNISEQSLFEDPNTGTFIFFVLGEGKIEGIGNFSYVGMVSLEPSERHSFCGEEDVSNKAMGSSIYLFPGIGALKLEISSGEQCMNIVTGEFRVKQTENVVQGSGALEGTTGKLNLDVEGNIDSGQQIHMTGELKIPKN